MNKIARILVPTDFALASERALAQAAAIAARSGAELHVLHVQELHRGMYRLTAMSEIEAVEKIIAEQSRQNLEKEVEKIAPPVVQTVRRDIKAGPGILSYAEEHDVDLIVMGTHARKGPVRMFIGSVAAEVLRDAEIPVLIVGPEHVLPADLYRRVLAPVDFSNSARAALQQASAIAAQHNAELIVLHVIEPRIRTPYEAANGTAEELRERARESLEEWVADTQLVKAPAQQRITLGPPDEQIVSCAREETVDLIVLGTVGLSGLSRLLLGSTTERVLRHAPCAALAHRGPVYEDI